MDASSISDNADDKWLYGDGVSDPTVNDSDLLENDASNLTGQDSLDKIMEPVDSELGSSTKIAENGVVEPNGEVAANGPESAAVGEEDDDSDEDDVHVHIGDIKTAVPNYAALTMKRGPVVGSGLMATKVQGRFTVEDFESAGTINTIPVHEFSMELIDDKPWRKPGADITDYFNYGFTEETWHAYCEKQKRIRAADTGAILNLSNKSLTPSQPALNNVLIERKKFVPTTPPAKVNNLINVIGLSQASRREDNNRPIDMMDVDGQIPFDISAPPPGLPPPQFSMPPPPIHGNDGGFNPVSTTGYVAQDYYSKPPSEPDDAYYNSFEPTMDSQWTEPVWDGAQQQPEQQTNLLQPPTHQTEIPPQHQMIHSMPPHQGMPPLMQQGLPPPPHQPMLHQLPPVTNVLMPPGVSGPPPDLPVLGVPPPSMTPHPYYDPQLGSRPPHLLDMHDDRDRYARDRSVSLVRERHHSVSRDRSESVARERRRSRDRDVSRSRDRDRSRDRHSSSSRHPVRHSHHSSSHSHRSRSRSPERDRHRSRHESKARSPVRHESKARSPNGKHERKSKSPSSSKHSKRSKSPSEPDATDGSSGHKHKKKKSKKDSENSD